MNVSIKEGLQRFWNYTVDLVYKVKDETEALIEEKLGKEMRVIDLPLIAAAEGQTQFSINLDLFDPATDGVQVQKGQLLLHSSDYTIEGNVITTLEPLEEGTTLGIRVYKNMPLIETITTLNGDLITNESISLDKLAEMPSAEDVGAYTKAEVDQLVASAVAAAKEEFMGSLKVTSDIPIHLGINENGGLSITYDDGK